MDVLENELDAMFADIETRLFPAQTYKSLLPALPDQESEAPIVSKKNKKKEQVHSPICFIFFRVCPFLSLTLSVSDSFLCLFIRFFPRLLVSGSLKEINPYLRGKDSPCFFYEMVAQKVLRAQGAKRLI